MYDLLYLTACIQHNVFQVHLWYSVCQYSCLQLNNFLFMHGSLFLILSSVDGHFGSFYFLVIVSIDVTNIYNNYLSIFSIICSAGGGTQTPSS